MWGIILMQGRLTVGVVQWLCKGVGYKEEN